MNLVFSPDSIRDLREVSRYTRKTYGKVQATWYVQQIEDRCQALASGHLRGRSAAGVAEGLHKQSVESHFIFFRIVADDLVIVRVLHEAMNHEDHLSRA